jgi:hypothetical protein
VAQHKTPHAVSVGARFCGLTAQTCIIGGFHNCWVVAANWLSNDVMFGLGARLITGVFINEIMAGDAAGSRRTAA